MNEYRKLSFATDSPFVDFYSYFSLDDLISKATEDNIIMLKCRTIGILQSNYGKFYLTDLDFPNGRSLKTVQMSVVYLKDPLPPTVIPYPIQVFGTLQWKNKPVIFAKTLQVLTTSNAFRLRNAMESIARRHQIDPTTVRLTQDRLDEGIL